MEQIEVAVVVGMVFVNAVFAAYEISLASVSTTRLQSLADQRRTGASTALIMKNGIEKSLAVVQLGITLVGLVAGATGGASAADDIAPRFIELGFSDSTANVIAICLVVAPLTIVTIVVGELVPKLFALRNKEWVCLTLSPLMWVFSLCVWPIVWFLEFSASGLMNFSEKFWRPQAHADARSEAIEIQELRAIASMARGSRLIGAREEKIILGAARLTARSVSEIMLPAEHIKMLCLSEELSTNLISAHQDLHTRFPVAERADDPQTIVGYANFKDIVTALRLNPREPTLRGIMREIPSQQADTAISHALESMLVEHTHITLVRDRNSKVIGMLTLEDIVEELVGDIQDEHDQLPVYVIRSGGGWILGGGANIAKIFQLTGTQLSSDDSLTLSAWVITQLSSPPRGGESIQGPTFSLLVRKIKQARVLEAILIVKTA
jgi:putative hemolysin